MSRPKLLPQLAPETLAALERVCPKSCGLAPRHEVNAEADPRLLAIVGEINRAEKHLRFMDKAMKVGTIESYGVTKGRPTSGAAQWARRSLDALTEVCRVATEAGDSAFQMHLEAIRSGMKNEPFPLRLKVWIAYKFCSISGDRTEAEILELLEKGSVERQPRIPTAGEVAARIGPSDIATELSARDCTNHLKALGLPYAPARRGRRKSI